MRKSEQMGTRDKIRRGEEGEAKEIPSECGKKRKNG